MRRLLARLLVKPAPVSQSWTIPHHTWGYSSTDPAEQGNGKLLPPAETGRKEENRPEGGTGDFCGKHCQRWREGEGELNPCSQGGRVLASSGPERGDHSRDLPRDPHETCRPP